MREKPIICEGCGAKLQFDNPNVSGYIPKEVYLKRLSEGKEILCQRCFQMKHYSKLKHIDLSNEELWKRFKKLLDRFKNVLWIIDIFDFEGNFRKEISSLLKNKNVIYVINKIDLLPKAVTRREMYDWLLERIGSDQIYLVSAMKKLGIQSLVRRLKVIRDDILIIGYTNAGKSSLINKICGTNITVSSFPNTTLDLIKIESTDLNLNLYDTPGITFGDRFIDILSPVCQQKILPLNELKRKTFKAVSEKFYLLGALVQIKVRELKTEKAIFQIFAPENVVIHETKPERVKELIEKQSGRFLVPPCKPGEIPTDRLNYKVKSIIINEGKEIVFPGIGWLTMKKGEVIFDIYFPDKMKIYKRKALINPRRRR